MLLKLYKFILTAAEKKFAPIILCLIAFGESIIFPFPPDMLLIPMSLAQRHRALFFAGLTTIFSVAGGAIGYFLGLVLWLEIGEPLINALGYNQAYSTFEDLYIQYGILIVIMGAFTPFPFKIIAILSGAMGYSFFNFLIAASLSRGLRFYIISGIIYIWGRQIDDFIKNYLGLLFFVFTTIIIVTYLFFQ